MTLAFDARERESVRLDLTSLDDEVRRLAVERIEALPAEDVVDRLVDLLGDPSWRVRKATVERLVARSASDEIVLALIDALGDGENTGRRNGAVEALVRCGGRAVGPLVAALETRDVDVRKMVVDTLAAIGDPAAVDSLVSLLDDEDPNVRAAATDALASIGTDTAAEALLATAMRTGEDQLVRFSALRALSALEVHVRADDLALALENPVLRPPALILLGSSEDRGAIPVLLKGLSDRSRAGREAAMRALLVVLSRFDGVESKTLVEEIREAAFASPEFTRSAVSRLEEADLPTSLVLVQFLGLLQSGESVIPILKAGRDEAIAQAALATLESMGAATEDAIDGAWDDLDVELRVSACELYGRRVGRSGARRLAQALESPSSRLRVAAARSVGRRRIGVALPVLVRRLKSAADEDSVESEEEIGVVIEALSALAAPGPDTDVAVTAEAVRLLADQLEESNAEARLAIAKVLGSIGREEDAPFVSFLLKDPEPAVRRAAVHALDRLEPKAAAEPLRIALADESPGVRLAAAVALGSVASDELIDDLAHLVDDGDTQVRAAVVRAVIQRFARSENAERRILALSLLDNALSDEAPVAFAAAEILREIGGKDALRAVALLQRPEPELVLEAVRCIGICGEEVEVLFPLIAHTDWTVRGEVIQLLARRGVAKAIPSILRRLEVEQDEFVREVILGALERLEG